MIKRNHQVIGASYQLKPNLSILLMLSSSSLLDWGSQLLKISWWAWWTAARVWVVFLPYGFKIIENLQRSHLVRKRNHSKVKTTSLCQGFAIRVQGCSCRKSKKADNSQKVHSLHAQDSCLTVDKMTCIHKLLTINNILALRLLTMTVSKVPCTRMLHCRFFIECNFCLLKWLRRPSESHSCTFLIPKVCISFPSAD